MCARPSDLAGRALRRAAAVTLALTAATLATTAGLPADTRPAAHRAAYPDTFPAGAARAIAGRACLVCHSPMLVTQQAKDSTGWERTLATMEAWGALLTPAEHDSLRAYLLAHFGARGSAKKP